MSEKNADHQHACVACPCDPKTNDELFGICICGVCGHIDDGKDDHGLCPRCKGDQWIQRADLCDPMLHDYVWKGIEAMAKCIGRLDPAKKPRKKLRNYVQPDDVELYGKGAKKIQQDRMKEDWAQTRVRK